MIFRKKSKKERIEKEIEKRIKEYAGRVGIDYIKFKIDVEEGFYMYGVLEKDREKKEKLDELISNDPYLKKLHKGPPISIEK